jgi:hypothetical protein
MPRRTPIGAGRVAPTVIGVISAMGRATPTRDQDHWRNAVGHPHSDLGHYV